MSRILILAETDGTKAMPQTGAAITFAQQTGLPHDILVLSGDPSPVASFGADKVLAAKLDKPVADRYASAAVQLAGGYSHVIGTSTTFGRDILPRVAALLGAPMLSDVMSIVSMSEGKFTRPMYAGAAIATVQIQGNPMVLSIRATAFDKPQPGAPSPVEEVSVGDLPSGTQWEGAQTSSSSRPDLTQARVVVSGGRPLKDSATFEEYIGRLADLLGGAVGATRAAVDSGIVGNDLQVGQTGKIVAPDLYIAAGISGSTQHIAGMGGSKVIVAINKDPEAPIFDVADYGLVADLYDAIPEMKSKLS